MKKIILNFFAILILSYGYAQDFTVNNYKVDIFIHQKGYFDVVENYDLNFEIPKHGIYRTIQTNYDILTFDGKQEKRKIKISKIEVPNYKFEAPFNFVQKMSDNLEIKIGDANVTLIGPQHYEIKYRVTNAFLHENSQIRFYWNIKPDGWHANFNEIEFAVHIPEDISMSQEDFFIYSGPRGTSKESEDFVVDYENGIFSGSSVDNFVSPTGDSVTLLINLPGRSIAEIKPFWPFWTQYGWSFFIVALVTGFYMVWRKHGKDDRVVATTSYYPPEGMDPAMAGFLIDDRDDTADLISLIPYWGKQGLIKIQEIPRKNIFTKKDTKITRLKPLSGDAPDYEREIFSGLFGSYNGESEVEVLVSSLENTFYTKMSSAKSKLRKKAQVFYLPESRKIRIKTILILIALAICLSVAFLFIWGVLAVVAVVITCIVLLILSMYLVKKNTRGNMALSELKGFKQFIKVSEQNKLKMLLKDDPGYFENTMGYALAFGLFSQWASKFDALNIPPPSWYSSTSNNTYTMRSFSKSFSHAMTATQSTMVSSPSSSSSGGGSSGGGFGGGGGGSW